MVELCGVKIQTGIDRNACGRHLVPLTDPLAEQLLLAGGIKSLNCIHLVDFEHIDSSQNFVET